MAGERWQGEDRGEAWAPTQFGIGALRLTLLFGSAAVALALILTPLAERQIDRGVTSAPGARAGVDFITTGSTRATGYRGIYTERRSVLQPSPQSVCVIRDNGMRSGDC